MRIMKADRALPEIRRGAPVRISVNGNSAEAYPGETVATALMAMGIRQFRKTRDKGEPRGVYCGMGVCYECLVTVDGVENVRACQTCVRDGMEILTGQVAEQ